MINPIARLFVWLAVPVAGCFGCPNHCFCYTWRGLVRTDCIRRNLFNTFVNFSHRTQVLDLSHNVITILHGNEFLDANLRHLQDLRLSNNKLHQIDKLSFNGLQFLQNLDLSHNSLEYLNPSTFDHNPNLKSLNVSFNPLRVKESKSFLSTAPSLQVLDLANCHLESVSLQSFLHLHGLQLLNISRNNIRKIDLKFSDGMNSLKYVDVSKNDIPCNDQTDALLRLLLSRKIQFRAFCETNQKIVMPPDVITWKTHQLDVEEPGGGHSDNTTSKISRDVNTIFGDIIQFFRSISSFYAAVFGAHIGVLIGSFFTYFCMMKAIRNRKTPSNLEGTDGERMQRYVSSDSDGNFALIPLSTPPGTPPSPYHSRFFSSNFSSAT